MKVNSPQKLWEEIAAHEKRNNYRSAMELYRQVISTDPENAQAHQGLANCLMHLQQWNEALAICQRALVLDPHNARAHGLMGQVYALQKRFPESKAALRKAIELNPTAAEPFITLALVLDEEHLVKEADEAIAHGLRLSPDSAWAHWNSAVLSLRRGRRADALREMRTAFKLQPSVKYALGVLQLSIANLLIDSPRQLFVVLFAMGVVMVLASTAISLIMLVLLVAVWLLLAVLAFRRSMHIRGLILVLLAVITTIIYFAARNTS